MKIILVRSWREMWRRFKDLSKGETTISCCDDPYNLRLGWLFPKAKTVIHIPLSAMMTYIGRQPVKKAKLMRLAMETDVGRENMAKAMLLAAQKS